MPTPLSSNRQLARARLYHPSWLTRILNNKAIIALRFHLFHRRHYKLTAAKTGKDQLHVKKFHGHSIPTAVPCLVRL